MSEETNISLQGIDPPAEMIPVTWINVNGRQQHEAILKDEKRMLELGLDPFFERMVYLKRWGSYL